jgi:hypothetical protein
MSDADNPSFPGFGKLVPGFDFLQNLAKQAAGSATKSIPQLPNLGNWVAPTLNVEELDKRIEELKAVQFWLDQNAMALKATIQALEVQKMTLATLKGMNFNMGDVANAFKLKVADSVAGGVQHVADKARTFSGLEIPPTSFGTSQPAAKSTSTKAKAPAPAKAGAVPAGVVDPMQWWGALTQQFQGPHEAFPYGHATHPQWQMAAGLVLAQLRAHLALPGYAKSPPRWACCTSPTTTRLDAQDILDHLSAELPEVTDWSARWAWASRRTTSSTSTSRPSVMLCGLPSTSTACFPAWRRCRRHQASRRTPRWCMPMRPRPTWPS